VAKDPTLHKLITKWTADRDSYRVEAQRLGSTDRNRHATSISMLYVSAQAVEKCIRDAETMRWRANARVAALLTRFRAYNLFACTFFAAVFFAGTAVPSFGGDTKAMTDSPSSRFSAVVIMLGDLIAFWASFLILGDVIAAGALGIGSFYVLVFPEPFTTDA
jgi:hypothetical protein